MTWQEFLKQQPDQNILDKISSLIGIINMKNKGISTGIIAAKYGYYPDNPEGDLKSYQDEAIRRGILQPQQTSDSYTVGLPNSIDNRNVQQAGLFSVNNIFIGLILVVALIFLVKIGKPKK